MKRFALLMLGLACLLTVPAVLAEGENADCTPKQYPLKPEEKTFFSKFTVLRTAIPKPPAGWQYSDDDKEKLAAGYKYLPASECEVSNYYVGLSVGYTRPMSQADSDREMAAMQAKPDPAKQKKLDALMAQQQALMQKVGDAAQKQDYKAMDALGKQNDALGAQITAVQQDMNSGSRAVMDAVQRDRDAKVSLAINDASGDVTCYGGPRELNVPGAIAYSCENPATYSSPGEQLDAPKGRIVVVYGKGAQAETQPWSRRDGQGKEHPDSYVDIKMPLDPAIAIGVQYVVINVEGDDLARAQSLYKEMNLGPLAALIKH